MHLFRAGLKQIVSNVEEQARADFAAAGGAGGGSGGGASSGGAGGAAGSGGTSSYSYSRSYRTTSGGQGKKKIYCTLCHVARCDLIHLLHAGYVLIPALSPLCTILQIDEIF